MCNEHQLNEIKKVVIECYEKTYQFPAGIWICSIHMLVSGYAGKLETKQKEWLRWLPHRITAGQRLIQ